MLSSQDKEQLIDALCLTSEAMGNVISASTAMMMAEDLSDYGLPELGRALRLCRREVKGRLTVSDIIQRCQAEDGRPGKDEAWSIALEASDEYGSSVMTTEIQMAMASSNILLSEGDTVGARMAFISTYERLVKEARDVAKPAEWHVSLGYSVERRAPAIQKAFQLGRIPADKLAQYSNLLGYDSPKGTVAAVAGLLTGKTIKPKSEDREKFMTLKERLKDQAEKLASMTPEERSAEHERNLSEHNKIIKGID